MKFFQKNLTVTGPTDIWGTLPAQCVWEYWEAWEDWDVFAGSILFPRFPLFSFNSRSRGFPILDTPYPILGFVKVLPHFMFQV